MQTNDENPAERKGLARPGEVKVKVERIFPIRIQVPNIPRGEARARCLRLFELAD